MKKSYLHVFSVLTTALVLLAGCRSEIQLDKVDPTIEAQMKLALPIGSISAKVSDFMGTSDDAEFYIDTLNGEGVVTWHRSFEYQKAITDFDIDAKIKSNDYTVDVYSKIKTAKYEDPYTGQKHDLVGDDNKIFLPAGYTYSNEFNFDVPMIIDGVNKPNLTQRVDSAQFDKADFSVKLSRDNFNDMKWEWIDTIKVDLGEQIKGVSPRVITLYKRGDAVGFDDKMPINLTNITLDLVKDHTKGAANTNVLDTMMVHALVKYTIPGNTTAQLYTNSGLRCSFNVESMNFRAVWGWFMDEPYYYGETLNISYDPYTFLNGARLPLAEPQIDGTMETKVAGNLKLYVDYLYSEDSAGVKHSATWNGQEKKEFVYTTETGCIDPKTSSLDDRAKISIRFDGTPENGDIDNLITEMPRKFAYRIGVGFDQATTPQIRITGDVDVKAKATAKVPIDFHKGIKIAYSDTIKGIKLEEANIDSLLKEVNWVDTMKTTNVHVYVTIHNGIPLDIKGTFYCLDANNNKIMDPENPSQVWNIFNDTLNLVGGTYDGATHDVTPAKSLTVCEMTKARLDLFPTIKSIVYDAYVTDDCIKNAQFGAQINGKNSVKVTLGLSADIDAIINLANVNVKDAKL